jgi:hypothetical protein
MSSSIVDELVAHGRGGERAHVEFDDGAAAWSEVVPQNAGPRCPVDTRLGCYGDSTAARAEEEVCVDLPAVGLRRARRATHSVGCSVSASRTADEQRDGRPRASALAAAARATTL